MGAWQNAAKGRGGAMDSLVGQPRIGLVTSVNADGSLVRVTIQPEGVLTGWLPVVSMTAGSGIGIHVPLWEGAQVVVLPDTGNAEHGVVLGATWNDQDPTPSAPSAIGGQSTQAQPGKEVLVTGPEGQVLRFCAGGAVYLQGVPVMIEGDLHVSGAVIAGYGGADQVSLQTHMHPTAEPGGPSSPTAGT